MTRRHRSKFHVDFVNYSVIKRLHQSVMSAEFMTISLKINLHRHRPLYLC